MWGFFITFESAGNGQIKNTMSQKLRAKFQVEHIADFGYGNKQVKLNAVYSNRNDEDNQFSQATPSGSLEMMVNSEAAKEFFEVGKKYYLDFEESPE